VPSRVIRGEINSSDSLARVSMQADLTFRALIVAVDDYGRIDARLGLLRSLLFPMRPAVSEKMLDGWLGELATEGCIVRYRASNRPYIQLCGWEQHRGKGRRADASRFPNPPANPDTSEIHGNPRIVNAIRPSDEGRGTLDEKRGTEGENARPPASPMCVSPDLIASVTQAFNAYGKRPREWNEKRKRKLRARLSESSPEALVQAVHGYAWKHREPSGNFNPMTNFEPETVFSDKFAMYLDNYAEAIDAGHKPPFKIQPRASPNGRGPTVQEVLADLDSKSRGDA
jgi:hypothetical protein